MARKSGETRSAAKASGAVAAERGKQPGGSGADKGANTPSVGSPPAAGGETKAKKELSQSRGSLEKSSEVSEDVFGKEFLKPMRQEATEKRSGAPTRTPSSEAAASNEDVDQKEKPHAKEKGPGEEGKAEKYAKSESESKGETAEVKSSGGKTEESATAADDKETPEAAKEKTATPAARNEPNKGRRLSHPKTAADTARGPQSKQDEKVSGAKPENKQETKETSSVPPGAKDFSAVISASLDTALPEKVVEAEKKFELAENAFVSSKDRAEELLQESKDLKGDTEASREAKREAAAAAAEAKTAEAAAQRALKEEVREFLGLEEGDQTKPAGAPDAEEPDSKEAAARVGKAKDIRAATEKATEPTKVAEARKETAAAAERGGGEQGKEQGAGASSVSTADKEAVGRKQEGDAKEEKRRSEGFVSPPALKVSPAHLLEYSKRRSSDRAAILAALAAVGLDTPETRAVVAAAEKEAAEIAEQEAAAAAAGKTEAEASEDTQPPTAHLNAFHRKTLAKLEGNQQYVLLLQQRLQEEIEALRAKYDRLMEPVFDERARILFTGGDEDDDHGGESRKEAVETRKGGANKVEGDRNEETSGDAAAALAKGDGKLSETAGEATAELLRNEVGTRALPGFWLLAFSNHSLLASLIGQRDNPLFLYLQNVRRVFHVDKAEGFSLIFEFGDNPFFTPQTLIKTFRMKEEEGGEWVVARTEGTAIQWAEGMDVTVRVIVRKQLNMRTKSERMVKEYIPEKSFFHFFKNSFVPTDEELEAMSDAEQTKIFRQLKTEYDAGVVIRDLIIPYAVNWYLGTAAEEADVSSEESEEEPEPPPAVKRTGSSAAAGPLKSEEDTSSSFASWFGF